MTKSKSIQRREAMRPIINTFDQMEACGGDHVAVSYHSPSPETVEAAKVTVWRVVNGQEIKTDPNSHWADYGCKTFLVRHPLRENKKIVIAKAIAWAKKTFRIRDEFVRNRIGAYVEKSVNEKFPIPAYLRLPAEKK